MSLSTNPIHIGNIHTTTQQEWEKVNSSFKSSDRFIVIDTAGEIWSCKTKEEALQLGTAITVHEIVKKISNRKDENAQKKRSLETKETSTHQVKRAPTEESKVTDELTNNQQKILGSLEQLITDDYNTKKIEKWKKESLNSTEGIKFHQSVCSLIEDLTTSPTPISLDLINVFHEILFNSFLKELSETITENAHICSVIKDLYKCFNKDKKDHLSIRNEQKERVVGEQLNNQMFFLKTSNEKLSSTERKWVFKPSLPEDKAHATTIPCSLQPKRELMAHVVNFHRGFPIPLTLLLNMDGKVYSVQRYIEGKVGLSNMLIEEESENSGDEEDTRITKALNYLPILPETFHRLLIFDLLFSNGDRHAENLIFTEVGTKTIDPDEGNSNTQIKYSVIGIDHGDCMLPAGNTLNIDYLDQNAFQMPLMEVVLDLVSEQCEEKYAELMSVPEYEIPKEAIEWMRIVCKCIRVARDNKYLPLLHAEWIVRILDFLYTYQLDMDKKINVFRDIVYVIIICASKELDRKEDHFKFINDELKNTSPESKKAIESYFESYFNQES